MKRTLLTALLTAGCLSAASANAVMITDWDFFNELGFDASSITTRQGDPSNITTSGDSSIVHGTPDTDYVSLITDVDVGVIDTMSWGSGASGPSSLVAESADGSLVTGGGPSMSVTLTHDNNPVSGDTLTGATLLDYLLLTPTSPAAEPGEEAPPLVFAFDFVETLNVQSGDTADCPDYQESGVVCDDLFVVTLPDELLTPPQIGDDSLSFFVPFMYPGDDYSDYYYILTTTLTGLTVLEDVACADGFTCVGFVTQEDNQNVMQAYLSIDARKVPEPGTLALLGLGLAFMGFSVRSRKAS